MVQSNVEEGKRLLTAVERLVDDCDHLIAQVEAFRPAQSDNGADADPALLELVAGRIIANYSTKSALVGGAAALPAIVPGVGSMMAVVGGSLADTAFMLKHEVEMALCLTHLYGYDIREERERWLAYILAGVSTYEAKGERNYFVDLLEAEIEALALYTPRQMSKLALTVMGRVAAVQASKAATKGVVRALPLLGVAVGLSANKFLTSSAGWRCVDALERRRSIDRGETGAVVDATVAADAGGPGGKKKGKKAQAEAKEEAGAEEASGEAAAEEEKE